MTIITTAIIAALAAQSAFAGQRANKPFWGGRATTGAPAAPGVITVNAPLPGAITAAMISGAPVDGGRAFIGRGRQSMTRGVTSTSRMGGKAFWGGRKVGGDAPAPEEAPPHFSKPGALIRTTGQAPVYEKAETARTHTVDAGEIVLSNAKAFDVGRAPSVQIGPKNTLPPPVSGGNGYGTGATANSAF